MDIRSFLNRIILHIHLFKFVNCIIGNKTIEMEFLKRILDNDEYNVHQRPIPSEGSSVTTVYLQNLVKNMHSFDDMEQEISVQVTLRTIWVDDRLRYDKLHNNISDLPQYVTINDVSRVWYPDIFVSNAKKGFINSLIKPNLLLRIYPNGTINLSIRVTFTATCQMNLKWYPFESHSCPINFQSYSLTTEELILKWHSYYSVQISDEGIQLNRVKFVGFEKGYGTFITALGEFSWANLVLKFRREVSYYVFNIYVPCMLLVVISWISFWFDVTSRDARVGLGITTILTLSTQIYSFNQSAPKISYIKAVDVYTGACQLFVCLALLEFATVDYVSRYFTVSNSKPIIPKSCKVFPYPDIENNFNFDDKLNQGRFLASKIDLISRAMFPIIFLGFNLVYFTVCIYCTSK